MKHFFFIFLLIALVLPMQPAFSQESAIALVSFDDLAQTSLSKSDLKRLFGATSAQGLDRTQIVASENGQALRVRYPAGAIKSRASGAQWKWRLSEEQEMTFTYRVKFDPDFDFVRGGKLPGFCGGDCNSGGNTPTGYDGWSARMMWRADGRLESYVYHPGQPSEFGHQIAWMHNPPQIALAEGVGQNPQFDADRAVYLQPGEWHEITQRVKVNDVGEQNGQVQGWLDGELVLDVSGIEFTKDDQNKISALYFSTFFGGSDETWAPGKDQFVEFDAFLIE